MDDKTLILILNDESTPSYVKEMPIPPMPVPPIKVESYYGGGFPIDTPQGRAAHCYAMAALGIKMATFYHGNPLKWASVGTLKIRPEAGVFFNAYYDRSSLRFYHEFDTVRRKEVYTSASLDITAHELGHAILDCVRPDLWNFSIFEIMAFHEAFGDWFAICNALQHPEVLERLQKETGGDLRKANSIAQVAEQFAMALYGTPTGERATLRNLNNSFAYQDPASLPPRPSSKSVGFYGEPHSFSQLMSGALWEILMLIFEDNYFVQGIRGRPYAFQLALDTVLKYVFGSLKVAAANASFYSSFAVGMVYTDITFNNSKYRNILEKVFIKNRKIIQLPNSPAVKPNKIKMMNVEGSSDDELLSASQTRRETLTLADAIGDVPSNPLFKAKIEIPMDTQFGVTKRGEVVTASQSTRSEAIKSVRTSLNYLHRKGLVGDGEHDPWQLKNGFLVRKQFSCHYGD